MDVGFEWGEINKTAVKMKKNKRRVTLIWPIKWWLSMHRNTVILTNQGLNKALIGCAEKHKWVWNPKMGGS